MRGAFKSAIAGVLGLLALASPAAAEPDLRKVVSMGSINHAGDGEDLTAHGNLAAVQATGARWVRLWIRWDKAQLYPPGFVPTSALDSPLNDYPSCGTGCGFRYIEAMDAQVAAARAAGLNVVLATWHYPRWSNGTARVPADWAREDRGEATDPVERLKPLEWRLPLGQLGPQQHYGRWLDWLLGRYGRYGRGLALEIMNEPNHQLWPQQAPSASSDPYGAGELTLDDHVAEMMNTARSVSAAHGHPILIAGPGLSDRSGDDTRLMTGYDSAVRGILAKLTEGDWGESFVWSHHNYADIEHDVARPTRAELVRSRLVGRWRGRGAPHDPAIWLTEGGARLGQVEATDLAGQAELVRRSWQRMTAAPGVEMWTNYLLSANLVANSGLRGARSSGGARRPVWDTFAGFPGLR